MKSTPLEELKKRKATMQPFKSVNVCGADFVLRRLPIEEYLAYVDWHVEQGTPTENRPEKFAEIIRRVVVADEEGAALFTNGSPREYLDDPTLVSLGTECQRLNGMLDSTNSEKDAAKN